MMSGKEEQQQGQQQKDARKSLSAGIGMGQGWVVVAVVAAAESKLQLKSQTPPACQPPQSFSCRLGPACFMGGGRNCSPVGRWM